MIRIILSVIFGMNLLHGFAQTDSNALQIKIDSLVRVSMYSFIADTSHVGASLGIYYKGSTFFYNYGSTEKGNKIKTTNNTIYEIGSISKTFAGILLAFVFISAKHIQILSTTVHPLDCTNC